MRNFLCLLWTISFPQDVFKNSGLWSLGLSLQLFVQLFHSDFEPDQHRYFMRPHLLISLLSHLSLYYFKRNLLHVPLLSGINASAFSGAAPLVGQVKQLGRVISGRTSNHCPQHLILCSIIPLYGSDQDCDSIFKYFRSPHLSLPVYNIHPSIVTHVPSLLSPIQWL